MRSSHARAGQHSVAPIVLVGPQAVQLGQSTASHLAESLRVQGVVEEEARQQLVGISLRAFCGPAGVISAAPPVISAAVNQLVVTGKRAW